MGQLQKAQDSEVRDGPEEVSGSRKKWSYRKLFREGGSWRRGKKKAWGRGLLESLSRLERVETEACGAGEAKTERADFSVRARRHSQPGSPAAS